MNKEHEPCEMCGKDVTYGFSLCDDCDDLVERFDEKTGNYLMKKEVAPKRYPPQLINHLQCIKYHINFH